ncbi:PPC domain [Arabidopsis suecica]|uniref:AT-hook motif nuclear-localized protein n=1 Tax=Arabidopsis suecica TaxID=45249 RepID=A0A8T1ZCU7_ARASU|nr:PPC domain [Arabidopsis suecica]
MEPNERHHHHHHQDQQQHHLTSPYYNPFHHHNPTTVSAAPSTTTSAGNSIPSSNNGNLQLPNDGSSSSLFSVPSSAVNVSIDPVKRKRGRPRKYDTPAQALAAKKLASSVSNSSARERREQAAAAAAAGVSPPVSKSGSRKSLLGSVGKTGQSFTPHIVNITPGEDVAQKIVLFAQQSKHELCVLSASGSISNASLSHLASGTSVSYEGQYEIISLSGSYIRGEHGGKTGGLSVCLSSSDGQIFGGGVGGLLKAAGPVQVVLGTFQLEKKKDGRNGVKGDDASGSGNMLPSPSGTESLLGYHPDMESSGRNPNDEHHTITSSALGGGAHFMMQPPQGLHMTHARPSEWGGTGYDLSGLRGNGSSENGDYE